MGNTPKFKYVLFDWDGTLLDSIPTWVEGIRIVLKKYNLSHLSDKEIVLKIQNAFEEVHEMYPIPDSQLFRSQIYETDPVINLHLSNLYDGVEDTLKFLHDKDIRLGIVTTSDRTTLENALSHHNVNKYFDVLITRQDVINRKPHPEPVIKCLNALGCDKKYAVYIGDSHHDTGAGRAAGVKTALHYPTKNEVYFDQEFIDASGADYVIRKLKEIHDWV